MPICKTKNISVNLVIFFLQYDNLIVCHRTAKYRIRKYNQSVALNQFLVQLNFAMGKLLQALDLRHPAIGGVETFS